MLESRDGARLCMDQARAARHPHRPRGHVDRSLAPDPACAGDPRPRRSRARGSWRHRRHARDAGDHGAALSHRGAGRRGRGTPQGDPGRLWRKHRSEGRRARDLRSRGPRARQRADPARTRGRAGRRHRRLQAASRSDLPAVRGHPMRHLRDRGDLRPAAVHPSADRRGDDEAARSARRAPRCAACWSAPMRWARRSG